MTTITETARPTTNSPTAPARIKPTVRSTLTRQTAIELRKSVDTRAGSALLYTTLTLLALANLGLLAAGTDQVGLTLALTIGSMVLSFVVPAIGVLAAASEWSNGSALSTFTLEPRRGRVMLAKSLAAVLTGLALIAAALGMGIAITGMGTMQHPLADPWTLEPHRLAGVALALTLLLLQGIAIGMATMNTALGLVISYLLPTVWIILSAMNQTVATLTPWLNLTQAVEPINAGNFSAETLAHLGVATVIGIGIPAAFGVWRLITREIK